MGESGEEGGLRTRGECNTVPPTGRRTYIWVLVPSQISEPKKKGCKNKIKEQINIIDIKYKILIPC